MCYRKMREQILKRNNFFSKHLFMKKIKKNSSLWRTSSSIDCLPLAAAYLGAHMQIIIWYERKGVLYVLLIVICHCRKKIN